MEYAFKIVEDFVLRTERLTEVDQRDQSSTSYHELELTIQQAKHAFVIRSLNEESDEAMCRLVRVHQRSLIYFADQGRTDDVGGSARVQAVESLIEFLQSEFTQCFDFEAHIPDLVRSRLSIQCRKCRELLDHLKFFMNVEPALGTTLTELLLEVSNQDSKISFSSATKISALCHLLLDAAASQHSEDRIRAYLIQLDFDTRIVFEYFTTSFRIMLSKTISNTERLDLLDLQLKKINQIPVGLQNRINHSRLKSLLMEWLLDEINYLERRGMVRSCDTELPSALQDSDFKLMVDMSVAQFAFLTRALVECGVIQNKNTSELMAFLAKFVKTKRSGSISTESLRTKYYDIEATTRDSVKNVLRTTIGYINKTK